jgi:hypothetical protein
MGSHPASGGYIYIHTQRPGPPGWGLGVGLQHYPVKKKIVEQPPKFSRIFLEGAKA